MAITGLLLDAGGTLLAEQPAREELYAQSARRRGLDVTAARMRACMSAAHKALPRTVAGQARYSFPWFERFIEDVFGRQLGLDPAALPALREELFATFADARNFRLLPGAEELLAAAKRRGLRLGLVSNWSPALPGILEGLGVRSAFDAVLVSSLEGVEKPEPAIFERALARLNVPPDRALHVGNEPVQDVQGASACGMNTLLYDPEDRHAKTPHARIRELAEIIPWIEERR